MHKILEQLLKKRSLAVEKLEPEEREQFDRWEKILSEGEINIDKITAFCNNQMGIIKGKMREVDNSDQKNERLVLLFSVYDAILEAIRSPAIERENLEKYLYSLIDKS